MALENCDNAATMAGYNTPITADSSAGCLALYIREDADLDGRFRAWDCENQEYIYLNGWLWDITQGHD